MPSFWLPGLRPGGFRFSSSRSGGFTLTELVVVIVVVGILAAVVLPKFGGQHGFEDRGFRDQTAAALRYAQKSAIASRRLVCVTFPSATAVRARVASAPGAVDCTAGSDLIGPTGAALAVDATGSAQFSPVPAALTFNARGQSTGASIAVLGLPANLVITVEAETGYVH